MQYAVMQIKQNYIYANNENLSLLSFKCIKLCKLDVL